MRTVVSRKSRVSLLADAAGVAPTLSTDPGGGILVPVVAALLDLPQRCQDVVPAALVFKRAPDSLGDESAPLTAAYAAVELSH
jgi:hypothetical protein